MSDSHIQKRIIYGQRILDLKIKRMGELKTVAIIMFCGFFCSVVFHYAMSAYLGLSYPYSTFLFKPGDCFRDFINMYRITKDLSPYNPEYFFNSNYLPLSNAFFWLFSLIPSLRFSLVLFLALFGYAYSAFVHALCLRNRREALSILVIALCSYPVLFSLDRANLELYLFLAMAASIHFYYAGNTTTSAIFLSIAISMKLYPGVFLLIFIKDKKYFHSLLIFALCIIFSLFSLLLFKGGIVQNIGWMLDGFKNFNMRSLGFYGIQHSPSLFGILKLGMYSIFGESALSGLEAAARMPYAIFVIGLFLVVSVIILRKKNMPRFEIVQTLFCVFVLFPHVSGDYKLLFFMISFFMFLMDRGEMEKRDRIIYAICYGVLFIPKDYWIIAADVSMNVPLNAAIMIFMAVFSLARKTPTPLNETRLFRRNP